MERETVISKAREALTTLVSLGGSDLSNFTFAEVSLLHAAGDVLAHFVNSTEEGE